MTDERPLPPEESAQPAPVEPAAADATAAAATPEAGKAAELPAADAASEPPAAAPTPEPPPAPAPPPHRPSFIEERPEELVVAPRAALARQSRRDFLLLIAGSAAAAGLGWWLLPNMTRARLLPRGARTALDGLGARLGLDRRRAARTLDRAIDFDDDVAEALYSKDRRVRTYSRTQVTPLRNNYNGQTPAPDYLASWRLTVSGLASGQTEHLTLVDLTQRFAVREQVTRLVCVEGWSAIAWWGGVRFADLLAAFPPAPGARYAALRSSVNLDPEGNPDPYYVSIDLDTARHPQTLLATRFGGQPLGVEHGAPLRLVVPMKLGLKNIKAITDLAYTAQPPRDYWNERGYSKYDGL